MTTLLVVTSDEHVNCSVGLCVQPVAQDAGGTFYPSKTQRAVAQAWHQFGDAVEAAAETARVDNIWWANAGDAVDLNKHDALAPITANRARIMDLALATYKRPAALSSRRFIIRGTEAHNGSHAELEELLGRDLQAEMCPDDGAHAWWTLSLECEGVLFNIQHHPKAGCSSVPWMRNNAAMRTAMEIAITATDRGERVADVAIRGHVHYFADSGTARKPRVFFLDGWQALTPYAYRRGYFSPSPVGGMWFVCQDGDYKEARWFREPKRTMVWKER